MTADYDYDQLFPGRFLKAGLFQGKTVTLTVADVKMEKLPDKKAGKEIPKPIMTFREREMELVLNRTNAQYVMGMFGRRTGNWVGKRITFGPAMVKAFGEQKLAIRVIGSPDIASDMKITVNINQTVGTKTMKKTTAKAVAPPPEEPLDLDEEAEEEEHDPDTGEIPFGAEEMPT